MSSGGRKTGEPSPLHEGGEQSEYQTLKERHRILDALVPRINECTGILMEMAVLERRMRAIEAAQKSE